jgi:hypothetical protein
MRAAIKIEKGILRFRLT